MKRLVLTLFLITTTFSIVKGLKCYDCTSISSYADCEGQLQQLTCERNNTLKGQYRCIKADVSYTLHSKDHKNFRKGCVKKEECSKEINPMCKAAGFGTSKNCDIDCCSTDLCNAGSNVMVSVVALVSCVLGMLALF